MFTDVEVAAFMEELDEKIQIINDNVLLLEKERDNQEELSEILNEIFRAAHTIKGSSAVMGYEKMASLTHEIENLFDLLRQGSLEVTLPLVDTLFEALDTLNLLRDEITGEGGEINTTPVVEKLKKQQGEDRAIEAAQKETSAGDIKLPPLREDEVLLIQEAELKDYGALWITVLLSKGCQMKAVRAYLVFETLQKVGEIIKSHPPAEEIQEGNFSSHFTLVLLTREDIDRIENLVLSIAEVENVHIKPIEISTSENLVPNNDNQSPASSGTSNQPGKNKITAASKTVRVDVQKLDTLMNLVGELVIDRTRLERFVEIFESKYGSGELAENIMEISGHLGQVTTDLQDEIMKARMLPISYIFNRLPRMVRDIANKMNKEIDFIAEGKETELDRNVIEVIGDPLIHLLRNAIDHGIELPADREKAGKPRAGTLKLKASYVEGYIVIILEDDGRGMDSSIIRSKIIEKGLVTPEQAERLSSSEVLEFIFAPGFSTNDDVNDISGRGVGMDIVRSQIEQINGSVEFDTVYGQGTTFTIKLPLTLAIIRTLMVTLGDYTYAFPLTNIVETLSIPRDEIKLVGHHEVTIVRGSVLPLVRLADIYNLQCNDQNSKKVFVVVLGSGNKKVGVIVERLLGEQEIVIKSLGSYLGQVEGLSGATILGDGRVALIVDARGIINESASGLEETAYAAAAN